MPAMWIPKRLVEISLINTAAKAGKDFVAHCEFEYESRIYAAASEILHLNKRIVMLSGPSASGKTTTAHKLAAAIRARGGKAEVISMDNFFKNLEDYPRLPDGSKDYENITAVDLDTLQKCLNEVLQTGHTKLPEFDFLTENRKAEWKDLNLGDGVCIVEGIHALNPQTTAMIPGQSVFKLYVGLREEYAKNGQRVLSTRDIRLARRLVRDYKFRGHSPEKTLSMWAAVCAGEDQYIKVFKKEADLLLDSSFSYEICALATEMTQMAGKLDGTPYGENLNRLAGLFGLCEKMPMDWIPHNSMLREFLG